MNLQFDPDKHIYRLDGKIIPLVTQIISEFLPIQYSSDDWFLERGRTEPILLENYRREFLNIYENSELLEEEDDGV